MEKKRKAKLPKRKESPKTTGTLIIIGGHEDKKGEKIILQECAKRIGSGRLVVATVASHSKSEELWLEYQSLFSDLGIKDIQHLNVAFREQSLHPEHLELIEKAKAFFFTGGDQLRITSELGGTMLVEKMHEIYAKGGLIAGTSAGASVMGDTMLVAGASEASRADSLKLGTGLGFIQGLIIDQHFAERGRIGRLLGAVAHNPKLLGIGIDEDTAIVVENGENFYVIGSGAVYVLDGLEITDTNICDARIEGALSLSDMRLHILSAGDCFELKTRRPTIRTLQI